MYMKTMLDILDERGWSHEEKAGLLWFIEGIMHINDDHLWEEWEQELDHRKEETSMYISLMERKGVEKEKLHMARRMLQAGESQEKILFYTRITPEELEDLRKNLKKPQEM
jgi:aspartate/tyrosine/aromatic aminotransferase